MIQFYSMVLGLDIIVEDNCTITFSIGNQNEKNLIKLTICDRKHPECDGRFDSLITEQTSETMPITFEVDLQDYLKISDQLKKKQVNHKRTKYEWITCESLFVRDPDGNILEFTCFEEHTGDA